MTVRFRWCASRRIGQGGDNEHTNTDAPPNEQAGTAISEQPLVARVIGSLLDK
jgi:hypothetical protein